MNGQWRLSIDVERACESSGHQSVSVTDCVDVEYNDDDDDCSESPSVVTVLMAEVPVVASTRPSAAPTWQVHE